MLPGGAQEARGRFDAGAGYRRPLGHDPKTLDPPRIRDIYSLAITGQIFDGLVQFDQTLTVVPALAQFWKASRDNLTWTFTLRKGIRFHDGRELTAEDVVYSLTRILDPRVDSVVAGLFGNITGAREFREGKAERVAGLTALDRYTVQVKLDDAPVPFVSALAMGHARIVPRDVVERDRDGFGTHPIGTGPFRFVRWERGKEIALAANPEYFDGPPRLARVIWRIFPGEQMEAMYEEFKLGNLEDAPIPTRNYRQILAEGGHIYVKRPMLGFRFYGLNLRFRPLNDRRVRQALLYAINREALVEDSYLGRYSVARGILPPGTLGFNPHVKGYAYDPEKARELLRQASYPGGRGLPRIPIWSSVGREAIVRELGHVKKDLEAVGIQVDINYHTDWPSFSKMYSDGRLPVFLLGWFADVPDPDNFLFRLFYSKSPSNFAGYANSVVDDLLLEARRTRDLQRRVDLYRRAEQAILDDAPVIPIYHHTYERLFQPYVRSIEVNGLGDPYLPLRKVWLDRAR